MKTIILPAILTLSCLVGSSDAGGLFSEDDGTVIPDHTQPVHWANRDIADAGFSNYPGYSFATPAFMSSWGKSPCGPDCWAVWAGYKTCHNFNGGHGCGHARGGYGCHTCAPKYVGCKKNACGCGAPKCRAPNCRAPKCRAPKCNAPKCHTSKCREPKCRSCCYCPSHNFGGRPRCGAGCGHACGSCGCDHRTGGYYDHAPEDSNSAPEQIESAPAEEVRGDVPMHARNPLSILTGLFGQPKSQPNR
jgi:hypothetical protein